MLEMKFRSHKTSLGMPYQSLATHDALYVTKPLATAAGLRSAVNVVNCL